MYFTAVVCHQTLQSPKKKKKREVAALSWEPPKKKHPRVRPLLLSSFRLAHRTLHDARGSYPSPYLYAPYASPCSPPSAFPERWSRSRSRFSPRPGAFPSPLPSTNTRCLTTFLPRPPGLCKPYPPPRLLSSTTDQNTGLRVDTYVKPLGVLRPGEVLNTDPTGELGKLLRPKMNSTDEPMLVVRLTFDLVHGDTFEPLPLDRCTTTTW